MFEVTCQPSTRTTTISTPFSQRSFDEMGTPLHEVGFCVLDLETTGGSAADCEITEIGAVNYLGGEETGVFQSLVNPGLAIPPFITILTGITHAMVIEAPPITEVLPQFLEFIGDRVIVGHNVRFDMSFLNAAATRLGYERLPNRVVDTCALGRRLVRSEMRNLKLATMAAHFRSPVTPNHRALDDAKATAHVLHALLERVGTMGVTALEDLIQLPTAKGIAALRQDQPGRRTTSTTRRLPVQGPDRLGVLRRQGEESPHTGPFVLLRRQPTPHRDDAPRDGSDRLPGLRHRTRSLGDRAAPDTRAQATPQHAIQTPQGLSLDHVHRRGVSASLDHKDAETELDGNPGTVSQAQDRCSCP